MRDATETIVRLRLVYLARLREAFDSSGETLTLAHDAATIDDVAERLRARGAPWAEELAPGRAVLFVFNHRLAPRTDADSDADEVATFPPVTAG